MKQFRVLLAILIAVTALVAVLFVWVQPTAPKLPQVRALWVTRFDYSNPEDVRNIIRNVGEAGFTDVFFQVRGNGTAFYNSSLEPWAYELSGHRIADLGKDPGWDPLQLAVDSARPLGLRVHAYMNVLPGWKGRAEPPESAGQLWTAHPDWFMVDSFGDKMLPTSGWYAFVNPVVPEVRQHLKGIVKELCAYDVAGIHLDYIRYPHDYHLVAKQNYPDATDQELRRRADFSYDSVSQSALYEKYGWDVTKKQIEDFRRDSVTKVVRDLAYEMQVERPGSCILSASVMGNPVEGRSHAYQDSGHWVRAGLIDWAVQMNYATRSFDRYISSMKKAAGRKGFRNSVVVGVYLKHDEERILRQIEAVKKSKSRGLALFSYTFLFGENHQITEKGRSVLKAIRP
ncbi:glycoside hydrolase family 10 protein [Pontiella agarivorans]|uniref:Family 10 glycosylhydrolase n=1 Tax=Pontiella agarivorans TaxID=3038953 RepID=A0ABU5N1W1_9BACT|nr:family 10 glycosylhydrolase [Pontiella agarivorans]MDZ8120383.1 family 10 glycosylhydrolase [Pontiella agarivorans]